MTLASFVDSSRVHQESSMRLVVVAASLGTVFEWYDFFLYGSLAVFFSALFFPPATKQRPSLRASPRLARALRYDRLALWCSGLSVTASAASAHSSSPW